MNIRVLLRRAAITIGTALAIPVGLLVWAFVFPPTYEAEHIVEPHTTRVRMQFTPSHPYLAEYGRSVVVFWANGRTSSTELFPDSGGYSRTQLYQAPDGTLYLKGYFDVAAIGRETGSLTLTRTFEPGAAKYLGAFAYVQDVGFRFLTPAVSPEEPLVAAGG